MSQVERASSLARALLALSRSSATGVLHVSAKARSARISLEGGGLLSMELEAPDDASVLGDLLFRSGGLDEEKHRRALERGAPEGPVGEWLVEAGAITRGALDEALRDQVVERLARAMGWEAIELRYREGLADVGAGSRGSPRATAPLVMDATLRAIAQIPLFLLRKRLGEGVLRFTSVGSQVLPDLGMVEDLGAMIALLERGAPVASLLSAGGGTARAHRHLWALRLLHVVAPPGPGSRAYRTLLRKRRQIRRSAAPSALLDLSHESRPEEARIALRRLARQLHPDRFSGDVDPVFQRLSNDVLSELVRAEARLRRR